MPDDVTRDLRAFTPLAADRDAILFAAGRGARRWTGWKWLAISLAVLNSATLGVLVWPKPTPPMPVPVVEVEPPAATPPDPHSYIALTRGWDAPPATDADPGPMPVARPLTPRAVNDFHTP